MADNEILLNDKGELMLSMDAVEGKPDCKYARFTYNEKWEAYLVRKPEQAIDFPPVPEEYRALLSQTRSITVREMDGDKIADVYEVSVISREAFLASLLPIKDNPKYWP